MDVNFTGYSFNFNENSCRCTCLYMGELRTPARGVHLATNVSVTIANILISIPGIVLNTLVLSAYVKNRHLHTSANMLLLALSLNDLCVLVLSQSLWVAKKILQLFVTFNCYVWVANTLVSQGTCGVSLIIITVLSVERFITLAYPLRYQTLITRVRLKVVICVLTTLLWVFVLCEVFGMPNNVVPITIGGATTFCIILVIVIWLWIHRLISRHKRQIATFQLPAPAMTNFKTVMRNTKTGYLVSGSLFLCFFPSVVASVYYVSETKSTMFYFYIIPWFETLAFANALLDPVILIYRKKDFRETIRHLLCQ